LNAIAEITFLPDTSKVSPVGYWRFNRPKLLIDTLAECSNATAHLDPLASFLLPLVPRKPLASQTIRAITRDRYSSPMLLNDAITCPWVSFDSDAFQNKIAIDIDHADIFDKLDRLPRGCPIPHVVIDPDTGRAHAFIILRTPVFMGEGAREAPKYMLKLAGKLLAEALGGTLMPHKALIKSPWGLTRFLIGKKMKRTTAPNPLLLGWESSEEPTGLMWHTVPGECKAVDLRDIIGALMPWFGSDIEQVNRSYRKKRPEPSSLGRNCKLFDIVRFWAYDNVEKDSYKIEEFGHQVNQEFGDPLPNSEVRATCRSIARFMNTRYRPRVSHKINKGRDKGLNDGMTLQAKQALAGRITNQQRTSNTRLKVMTAVDVLGQKGIDITQKNVSHEAGLSVSTVKRLWSSPKVSSAILSGSGSASQLSHIFSKTIKEISVEDKFRRREEVFYSKIIAKLEKKGSKPLESIREPIGFQSNNPDHVNIFDLFNHAVLLNQHAKTKAKNRQKALESKARRAERQAWHTENNRLPYGESWGNFDVRIKQIKAEHMERIESIEQDKPEIAELLKMGMGAILSAEWRARANARNQNVRPVEVFDLDLEGLED
jgi:hypothetical protein